MTAATVNDRAARLARVLEEHECWEHPGWPIKSAVRESEHRHLIAAVLQDERDLTPGAAALLAAIREVEPPYEVLGSPTRCAICDGTPAWGYRVADCTYFLCRCVRYSGPNHGIWREAGLADPGSRDDIMRAIVKARRLYREAKAEPPTRIFTGVDWGVDGSCCIVRLRREADGRWTLLDEMFEPAKAKPVTAGSKGDKKPEPASGRVWGWKAGTWPHDAEGDFPQGRAFQSFRDRLRAGKIRAEVPFVPTASQARVVWRDTCARSDCAWRHGSGMACSVCSGWRQADTWMSMPGTARLDWSPRLAGFLGWGAVPLSGNSRGDGFLRALWREDEKRTQALRDAAAERCASGLPAEFVTVPIDPVATLRERAAAAANQWALERMRKAGDALVERVADVVKRYMPLGFFTDAQNERLARAVIAEVRKTEGGR